MTPVPAGAWHRAGINSNGTAEQSPVSFPRSHFLEGSGPGATCEPTASFLATAQALAQDGLSHGGAGAPAFSDARGESRVDSTRPKAVSRPVSTLH